eukprot:jgi/Psemu1/313948/fgenesh1_kg.1361_\
MNSKWNNDIVHSVEKAVNMASHESQTEKSIALDEQIPNISDIGVIILNEQVPNVEEEGSLVLDQQFPNGNPLVQANMDTPAPSSAAVLTLDPTEYKDPCGPLEDDCMSCLSNNDCLFCRGEKYRGFCFNRWPDLATYPTVTSEESQTMNDYDRKLQFQEFVRLLGSHRQDNGLSRLRELQGEFCDGYVTSSSMVCDAPTQPPVFTPAPIAPVAPTPKPTAPPPTGAPIMKQGIILTSAGAIYSPAQYTPTAVLCGMLGVFLLLGV